MGRIGHRLRVALLFGVVAVACQHADVTDVPPLAGQGGRDPMGGAGGGAITIPTGGTPGGGASPGLDPDGTPRPDAAAPPDDVAPSSPDAPEDPPEAPPAGTPACMQPPCIDVRNDCPVPLWTHAIGNVPIDDGQVRRLDPGQSFHYEAVPEHGGGRLYAYYKEPLVKRDVGRLVSDYNQFVEMTIDRDERGRFAQNYNISYVDYLSLPVSMKASGATCAPTTCGLRFTDWVAKLKACPTDLRNVDGDLATCTASYEYCLTRDGLASYDTTRPYCHKMTAKHGLPGSAIYGGTFPERPATDVAFWDGVAAWNRGTFAGDADDSNYYKAEPYNHYAAFVHQGLGCPRVYAFSTDDHQDKAGFVRCTADQLSVVWCPNR